MPEKCESLEELRWQPGLANCDLKMYLRAARSMAAFAGMCDGGSAEDGCLAASRDDTTINALQLLHESSYDTGKALQALVKSPVPKGIEKKWTEEEQKRFVKGLRTYGKNFFKIRRELLSHKDTPDLVEYYYLWKKTPQAAQARPRRHRSCVLRRGRNANSNSTSNPANKTGNSKEDNSSASEEEVDDQTDDSEVNTVNTLEQHLLCSNCGAQAKELHQTGKDRSLLCHECRSYLKKHGEHRPNNHAGGKSSDAASMFLKAQHNNKTEDDLMNLVNGKPNLRTRKGKDKLARGNSKSSETESPEAVDVNDASESKANGVDDSKMAKAGGNAKKRTLMASDTNNNSNDSEGGGEDKEGEHKEGEQDLKRKKLEPGEDGEDFEVKFKIEDEDEAEVAVEEGQTKPAEAIDKTEDDNKEDNKGEDEQEEETKLKVKEEHVEHNVVKMETEGGESAEGVAPTTETTIKQENKTSEQGSPPRSPQDLSSLSSREKHPSSDSGPAGDDVAGRTREESGASGGQSSGKVSPPVSQAAGLAGPIPFPFGANFAQFPPTSSALSDRFSSMMPGLGLHAGMGLPQDVLNHSPKLPPGVGEMDASKLKNDQNKPQHSGGEKSSTSSVPPTVGTPKSSSRSMSSPKTVTSFPNLSSPFTSTTPSDLLFSHPSFSPAHLPPGATPTDRLPFPGNPLLFPPGYSSQLFPFMAPFYNAGGRLPPGAFPPPGFMPPGGPPGAGGPMSSPHSQMSKSKSPMTSQSPGGGSGHHSSPHFAKSHDNLDQRDPREMLYQQQQQQDDDDNEPPYISKGPSPEPRIEDSECHRSQAAIFLRHWNRGEHNSCARTDLIFKPAPGSRLANKRDEKARKLAEKERDEHKRSLEKNNSLELSKQQQQQQQQQQSGSMHGQLGQSNPNDPSSSLISPLGGRHTPRNFAAESNALRQLSEYARPSAAYSPFSHANLPHHLSNPNMSPLGLPGAPPPNLAPSTPSQHLDYQLAMAQYQQMIASAKEMEDKKQRELELNKNRAAASQQQQQQQQQAMPPTSSASSIYDQHQLEMQRRLSSQAVAVAAAAAVQQQQQQSNSGGGSSGHNNASMGGPGGQQAPQLNPYMMAAFSASEQHALERLQAERFALNDPIFRMQMGLGPELHGAGGPGGPGHPFSHPSAHPSLHPGAHGGNNQAAAAAAQAAAENAAAAAASIQLANAMSLSGSQFDPATLAALHPLGYPSRSQQILSVPRPDLGQASSLYRSSLEDQLSQIHHAQAAEAQAAAVRQLVFDNIQRERFLPYQSQLLQDEFLRQRQLNEAAARRPPM